MIALKYLVLILFIFTTSACKSSENKLITGNTDHSVITKTFSKLTSGELLDVVNSKGIYICRIFNSGNLGGRGKDNCATYKSNEIHSPDGIIAKVPDETPIDILWVFPSSSKIVKDKVSDIPIIKAVVTANKTSPSELSKELVKIIESSEINLDLTPAIIVSNQQIIFIDGQIIDDALVGGVMMIKSNTNGSHSIEAIYDYR